MAKKDVVRLLVRLFGDPKLHGKYRAEPKKVLKAAGLNRKERELLVAGDEDAIREYLGRESAKTNVVKSGLTNVVKSASTNVVKSALTNVVKSGLTNVVKTAIRRPRKPKPKG